MPMSQKEATVNHSVLKKLEVRIAILFAVVVLVNVKVEA